MSIASGNPLTLLMFFRQIADEKLAQYAYLIGCQKTGEALLIDPERDVDRYLEVARGEDLQITAVAETHIHADFLSGARELAERHGATLYLSDEGGADWKYQWSAGYDVQLLKDGDTFQIGHIEIQAVHTPGHTPEHLSYLITDSGAGAAAPLGLASGDFVFVGDTGRPDLLETAAGQQGAMQDGAAAPYDSVHDFLNLEDYLQVWPGHGAGSACGKALGAVPETTVGYERRVSAALRAAREGRDAFIRYILEDQPEPPLYFERMKLLNRNGPPLLGDLPQPKPLSVEDLRSLAARSDATLLDTRLGRAAFMRRHLEGAIYAPMNKSFPTIAGSYAAPDAPVYLIAETECIQEAVRSLVRVGLDDVRGLATPQALQAYAAQGGVLASIEQIDMRELERRRHDENVQVVDVRSLSEYRAGHVPDAVLRPHTRLRGRLDDLPRGKQLLVHCGSGTRAASAGSLLARHGHNAVHVEGYYADWAKAHDGATETESAPTTTRA